MRENLERMPQVVIGMSKVAILKLLASLLVFSQVSLLAQSANPDDLIFLKGTYFGNSTNSGYVLDMTSDSAGNIYAVGVARSIAIVGPTVQTTNAGDADVFVVKFNPLMSSVIWSTYLGGSGYDAGTTISVTKNLDVVIGGVSSSRNFPVTTVADTSFLGASSSTHFVAKISANGTTLLFSRALGFIHPDSGLAPSPSTKMISSNFRLSLNQAGEIYTFGTTQQNSYTVTANAFQAARRGGLEMVISKLSATGTILYSTFFGDSGDEIACDVLCADGKVYFVGTTGSTLFPLKNRTHQGGRDGVAIIADDLAVPNFRKSVLIGTSSNEDLLAIAYEKVSAKVYISGFNYGPTGFSPDYSLRLRDTTGGFILRMDKDLNTRNWLTSIGGGHIPYNLKTRWDGAIYVGGNTRFELQTTINAMRRISPNVSSPFFLVLDKSGTDLRYSSLWGPSGDNNVTDVELVEAGCELRVVLSASTYRSDFPMLFVDEYQSVKRNSDLETQPVFGMLTQALDPAVLVPEHKCFNAYTFTVGFTCTGVNYTVLWEFGDGSKLQAQGTSATHTYRTPGNYYIIAKLMRPGDTTYATPLRISIRKLDSTVYAGADIRVCKPGTKVQLKASGCSRYSWQSAPTLSDTSLFNPTVSPTVSTQYLVRGVTDEGCVSTDSVTVFVSSLVAQGSKDTTICQGTKSTLRASGAAKIRWFPFDKLSDSTGVLVTASPDSTTIYKAVISEGNCTDTLRVKVTVLPIAVATMPPPPTLCKGSSTQLNVKVAPPPNGASYSFTWTPAQDISDITSLTPIVSPTSTRVYRLSISNQNGCTSVDSIVVTVRDKITVSTTSDTTLCRGSVIQLRAEGASEYQWHPSTGLSDSISATPFCAAQATTTYTVTGSSGTCVDTQKVTVTVVDQPSVALGVDKKICYRTDSKIGVVNPLPGLNYSWTPDSLFQNPNGDSVIFLGKGTATIRVTARNSLGCEKLDSATVSVDTSAFFVASQDTTVCEGSTALLRVVSPNSATVSYSLSPPDAVFDPTTRSFLLTANQSKSYVVVGTSSTCSFQDTVSVTTIVPPSIELTRDTVLCGEGSVLLRAVVNDPRFQVEWLRNGSIDTLVDTPNSQETRTKVIDTTTTFEVFATNGTCVTSSKITIHVAPPVFFTAPPSIELCRGDTIPLSVSIPTTARVNWDPPTGLSSTNTATVYASPDDTVTYTITVTDTSGCSSSRLVTLFVGSGAPFSIWVDSVRQMVNESAEIVVHAKSAFDLTTDLRFDVSVLADMFVPRDSTRDSIAGDYRLLKVDIRGVPLRPTSQVIARIKGTTFSSKKVRSPLKIHNRNSNSVFCAREHIEDAEMELIGCFVAGRAVVFGEELKGGVSPNPVTDDLVLSITSDGEKEVDVSIVDGLGLVVTTLKIAKGLTHTESTIPITTLSSGLYFVRLRSGSQTFIGSFIKRF